MTVTRTYPSGQGRLRYAGSLLLLAAKLILQPRFPLPEPSLRVRVPQGADRGAQLAALADIADGLGTVERTGDGILYAAQRIGTLTVEAHVPAEDTGRLFAVAGAPGFGDIAVAAGRWNASIGGAA